jgi:hypothetical protein
MDSGSSTTIDSINISYYFTHDELKLWHILLHNAYSGINLSNRHSIALTDIYATWGKNITKQYLLKTLERLSALVQFHTIEYDQSCWHFFSLLPGVTIENGICYYNYAPLFKKIDLYPAVADYLTQLNLLPNKPDEISTSLSYALLT